MKEIKVENDEINLPNDPPIYIYQLAIEINNFADVNWLDTIYKLLNMRIQWHLIMKIIIICIIGRIFMVYLKSHATSSLRNDKLL